MVKLRRLKLRSPFHKRMRQESTLKTMTTWLSPLGEMIEKL